MSIPAPAPLTRRINRGRYHEYLLDDTKVPSVTTIIREGVPKPALVQWAAREVAGYAVDHRDELAKLSSSEVLRRLERAPNEKRNQRAARGTEVHALAARLAAGEELEVPEPLVGHVDAYLAFVRDWQPRELLVEATILKRQPWGGYMGTLDLVAQLCDERVWLLDFKTTASGVWPETALQAAAYRHADAYLDAAGVEQPMPAVDRCGSVWLRADGYDLIPLETGPDVFRFFNYAMQVARFAKAQREEYVGDALRPAGVAA
jgi:hypothetical protein